MIKYDLYIVMVISTPMSKNLGRSRMGRMGWDGMGWEGTRAWDLS